MRRTLFTLLGVLIACLIAFSFLRRKPAEFGHHVTVRLKWLHQAQFAGFYAADQLGKYRAKELSVDLLPGGIDTPAIFQVLSGAADYGVTGADQVLLARAEGHPIVAIAVIYRQTPFTLFSRKNPRFTSLASFAGQKVGVKYGTNDETTYRAMLAAANLPESAFKEIGVKYDMTPFFTGDVALWPGYRTNEPLAAKEKGIAVTQFNPEDFGVKMYADVIIASELTIKKRPDITRRFVVATMEGWQSAITNPVQAAGFVKVYNPDADLSHEKSMMEASIPLIQAGAEPVGLMRPERWQSLVAILEKHAKLKPG
ncbi:MAG: ABC transporter substrate-binding protein, partial [Candidatus Sulfotelmatobacter sp.]